MATTVDVKAGSPGIDLLDIVLCRAGVRPTEEVSIMSPSVARLVNDKWNPNQRQAENTLRLIAMESPADLPEVIEIVKKKGLSVPESITPATGWQSFR